MFSYPFHIRDYTVKTRHLSLMEDLAYRRLIDAYYTEEGPLPADVQACARLIAMRDYAPEVEAVLREFFVLSDGGWSNERCDYEISRYVARVDKAKRANNVRWGSSEDPQRNASQIPTREPEPENQKKSRGLVQFDRERVVWVGVSEKRRKNWEELYPDLDVEHELKKSAAWADANPAKARDNWAQFLNSWMERANAPRKVDASTTRARLDKDETFVGLS